MLTAIHPRPHHALRRQPVWFRPATIALSRGAFAALQLAALRPHHLIHRHLRADWGLFRDDDARENDWALTHAGPVRSLFELPTGAQVLVETDDTRTLTCLYLVGGDAPPCPCLHPSDSSRAQADPLHPED